MKVLIANNMAPFVWGGAEELARQLQMQLTAAGHTAEILRIPFQWEPPDRIPSQMLMARALELPDADRVIALKFPAYLVRHPRKTLWLLHQFRQAYDLYGTDHSNLSCEARGMELRNLIVNADAEAFLECRRIFTNSDVTRQRLAFHNGVPSDVLLPPLNDAELFGGGTSRGYIFAGGRINPMKRQHLLIDAVARAGPGVQLVVGGPPDTPADAQRLIDAVRSAGLEGRVTLDLRFLPRAELASYVNHAAAVAYLPYDEDSLGYVAMEAAAAAKPLISATDSGGVLRLAAHLETGWVADPDPHSIADALSEAAAHPERCLLMGRAARERWDRLDVTWAQTLEKLLS